MINCKSVYTRQHEQAPNIYSIFDSSRAFEKYEIFCAKHERFPSFSTAVLQLTKKGN